MDDLEKFSNQLKCLPLLELSPRKEKDLVCRYQSGTKDISSLLYRYHVDKIVSLITLFRRTNPWVNSLNITGPDFLSSATVTWLDRLSSYNLNSEARLWTYSSKSVWFEGILGLAKDYLNERKSQELSFQAVEIADPDWVEMALQTRDINTILRKVCHNDLDRTIVEERILADQKTSSKKVALELGIDRTTIWRKEKRLKNSIKQRLEGFE